MFLLYYELVGAVATLNFVSDYATMYMLQLQLLLVDNNHFKLQTILLAGALLVHMKICSHAPSIINQAFKRMYVYCVMLYFNYREM